MMHKDWSAARPWAIPEGITLREYAICYTTETGLVFDRLEAPSLNLAIRRFILLELGDLVEIREVAQPDTAQAGAVAS